MPAPSVIIINALVWNGIYINGKLRQRQKDAIRGREYRDVLSSWVGEPSRMALPGYAGELPEDINDLLDRTKEYSWPRKTLISIGRKVLGWIE